jgi:hypothetical protein
VAKDMMQTGKHHYRIEQGTFRVQSNNPMKVHSIERLRWERFVPKRPGDKPRRDHNPDELAYRIGYWVVTRREDDRVWGQYSLIAPVQDLESLLEKAREEGTLLQQ